MVIAGRYFTLLKAPCSHHSKLFGNISVNTHYCWNFSNLLFWAWAEPATQNWNFNGHFRPAKSGQRSSGPKIAISDVPQIFKHQPRIEIWMLNFTFTDSFYHCRGSIVTATLHKTWDIGKGWDPPSSGPRPSPCWTSPGSPWSAWSCCWCSWGWSWSWSWGWRKERLGKEPRTHLLCLRSVKICLVVDKSNMDTGFPHVRSDSSG